MACDYMHISRLMYLLICKVNDVQTFRTIEQFFKDTCILSVSLAQHIIGGPVRHIVGITFAWGSLLRSYRATFVLDVNNFGTKQSQRSLTKYTTAQ